MLERLPRIATPAAVVAALTAIGFVLRMVNFGQGLFGDELSTAWIVSNHSLGHVLHEVRSNDEITPPLYFVLAWASSKLGSNPELIRLPSLVAGVAAIPLTYAVGLRTVGRWGGVMAAAITALSPFLIYYSTEARSYAVMIAFVLLAVLGLLKALDEDGRRWWALYAVASAGAMYSHYTSVFPLLAAFAWSLGFHRDRWRAILLANAGAVVLFAPWLPGFIADNNSPTTAILSGLQPFNVNAVRTAIENWSLGFPYLTLHALPGVVAVGMIAIGLAIAAAASVTILVRAHGRRLADAVGERAILVGLLVLATPVAELVYSAVGTNLLGARNLNSAWPGLALAIGGVIAAAPVPAAAVSGVLVLGGYAWGAVRATQPDAARSDYPAAAAFIDANAGPGDVVVDSVPFTPVPQTGLDTYLAPGRREFRLGLPRVSRPFLPFDPVPDVDRQIAAALRDARGHTIFLLAGKPGASRGVLRTTYAGNASRLLDTLPPGWRVVEERSFPGVAPLEVLVIRSPS